MKRKQIWKQIGVLVLAAAMVIAAIGWALAGMAEEHLTTMWVMCQPGGYVNVREKPNKNGEVGGFLESGEYFRTDGETVNGFVRAYGIGENDQGWIYCGYVVTEEPEAVFENYYCSANERVACRKWVDGPRISGSRGWINNGDTVTVFYEAEGWAVTSRGYIRTEWIEVDPE